MRGVNLADPRLWGWFAIALAIGGLLYVLSPILAPFLAGAILAYILNPLVARISGSSVRRTIAVVFVLFMALLGVVAVFLIVLPLFTKELRLLAEKLPEIPLVAAFETGFHATIDDRQRYYPVPYEWAEKLHLWLVKKKLVTDQSIDRRTRSVFWLVFALLALFTGYTVYEAISPTGILSRALIYGPGLALLWVLALLVFEVFFSRRAWCRYACPIGLTYGFVGATSPVKVQWDANKCLHEGNCRSVCLVPHVLEFTIKNRAHKSVLEAGPDCTRCAMCLEACLPGALSFKVKGVGDLL